MKKKIDINECSVRLATGADVPDLEKIARGIWDGNDYLPKVLPRWLAEPFFFVCQYRGRVIACIKLSLFPDNVLWFEGLRVLSRYQGRGIGSFMNREMFRFAAGLKQQNPLLQFEFCTYYQNVESLHLTQKIGFKQVDAYYCLDKHGIKRQAEPKILQDYNLSFFSAYPQHIPLGWQCIHNCPEAVDHIKSHATVFQTPQTTYMLAGLAEKSIVLLSPPPKDIKAELPYFQFFYPPLKRYSMIIPAGFRRYLKHLKASGFHFWDKEAKPVLNMLVLRKD